MTIMPESLSRIIPVEKLFYFGMEIFCNYNLLKPNKLKMTLLVSCEQEKKERSGIETNINVR